MVWLGFEPGAAGWKAEMNPLSYGGTALSLNCLYLLAWFATQRIRQADWLGKLKIDFRGHSGRIYRQRSWVRTQSTAIMEKRQI